MRIQWTTEEVDKVVWNAAYLLKGKQLSPLQALRIAQKTMLPEHRQRKLDSKASILIARVLELSNTPKESKPSVEYLTKKDVEGILEEFFFKLASPMIDSVTGAIKDNIESSIQNVLQSALSGILNQQRNAQKPTVPIPVLKDTSDMMKRSVGRNAMSIVIIGVLPIQEQEIMKDFGDKFDLKFFDSDANLHQMEHTGKQADCVLINTKFISHKVTDKLKTHPNVVLFQGGVSRIRQILSHEILQKLP